MLRALTGAVLLALAFIAPASADDLGSYLTSYICADGSVPPYGSARLDGLPSCRDGSFPAPAKPDTPLPWRKLGRLWHAGDSHTYHEATNGIVDGRVFYDVTATFDVCKPDAWSPVANPPCLDGAMNVMVPWRFLGSDTAYGWSTWWGLAEAQYFNGLQCPGRPAWARVRYPIIITRRDVWQRFDEWWPNQITSHPTCASDGLGRITLGRTWRGMAWRHMAFNGLPALLLVDIALGETYWFESPTPLAVERLEFDRYTGFGVYQLFYDSSLGPPAPTPAGAPDDACSIKSKAGADLSRPSVPTGTVGHWVQIICVDFNDIEGEAWSLAPGPGATGMPKGWNARQFFRSLAGFPGDLP